MIHLTEETPEQTTVAWFKALGYTALLIIVRLKSMNVLK